MERVTTLDLERVRDNLNRRLEAGGSDRHVVVERRYGYVALDEADHNGVLRTLSAGNTAREARRAMVDMIRALDMLPYEGE